MSNTRPDRPERLGGSVRLMVLVKNGGGGCVGGVAGIAAFVGVADVAYIQKRRIGHQDKDSVLVNIFSLSQQKGDNMRSRIIITVFIILVFTKYQDATAACVTDNHGKAVCGAGECLADTFGKITCSEYRDGGCATDQFGKVICGAGKCMQDIYGKVICSEYQGGDCASNQSGNVICGPGQCLVDISGRVVCSNTPRGSCVQDVYGKIICN